MHDKIYIKCNIVIIIVIIWKIEILTFYLLCYYYIERFSLSHSLYLRHRRLSSDLVTDALSACACIDTNSRVEYHQEVHANKLSIIINITHPIF